MRWVAAFWFASLGAPIAASATTSAGSAAQEQAEVRVLAVVDYVSTGEVYLAAGTEQGLREGDTLAVYAGREADAERLGRLVIQSVTERRSVAVFPEEPFPLSRRASVYLGIPSALVQARAEEARQREEAAAAQTAAAAEAPAPAATEPGVGPPQARRGPPVRLNGRIAMDMDALQTTTRWGDTPAEEVKRTFSTPTFRLQARAQDLPGGLRFATSMRLSHRTSTDDLVQPTTSLRFYQFDVEKRFETAPVQLHLGRFHNPFDDFGGYWDGFMAHVGGLGPGAGFAVGYEPEMWNEGVSTKRPKVSGFVDYTAEGETADYSGALSFQTLRPTDETPDRTYVGLSQRLRLGGAWFRQRLQIDRSADGADWSLTRLQFDASVPVSEGLSAHGGWRRWRAYNVFLPSDSTGPLFDRANAGLSFWSVAGGLSVDLSLDRPEVGEGARTMSSSFYLRSTPLLGLGFSGMASYWTRGEDSSLLLSPEVRRNLGRAQVRGGYRFYQTEGNAGRTRHQFADLGLTLPLGGGVSARVQGSVQWGGDFTSNRIFASLWKMF